MDEEEKKAFEFFKLQSGHWKDFIRKKGEKTIEDIIINLIEKQQKENKKLEEEKKTNLEHINFWRNSFNEAIDNIHRLEEENKEYKKQNKQLSDYLTDDFYIPETLIRDKIKECNKLCGNLNFGEWYYKKEILQELLEERNK